MTKKEAIKNFADYLKTYNISHATDIDDGCPRFTMAYSAENAPNYTVESCIWFYEQDVAEARCYYTAMGSALCRESEYKAEFFRLLNFINARVFLDCGGCGLYEPHMLYNPRIYVTEDDCFDITITTIINYDFWEVAPIETMDYLTAYCPELLDRLTMPIFGVLLGKMTVEEAICHIQNTI